MFNEKISLHVCTIIVVIYKYYTLDWENKNKSRLPEDFEVCKTSPIKSRMRNDGFGHSMAKYQCARAFLYPRF